MKHSLFFFSIFLLLSPAIHAKIVFVGGENPEEKRKLNVFVMNDDGTSIRQITDTPEEEGNPNWSPDGQHIAFERSQPLNGNQQVFNIFLVNADGSNQQRLTNLPTLDATPVFLPDGVHLAYYSKEALHIVNVASRVIKHQIDGFITAPHWSPDGQFIVYQDWGDIYTMTAGGENKKALLPPPQPPEDIPPHVNILFIERFNPKWSPDGLTILYIETAYDANGAVSNGVFLHSVIRENGQQRLPIHKDWRVHSADWMGNADTIVLSADEVGIRNQKHGDYNIYRYHIPSQTMTQLTYLQNANISVDWVQGSLVVSPEKKKNLSWGEVKQMAMLDEKP